MAYVRPILEYNSVVRPPSLQRSIETIEEVQRGFTKSIGVPDRGAGRAVAPPLGFEKLVKFGQMRWEIRAFRGLNFSR